MVSSESSEYVNPSCNASVPEIIKMYASYDEQIRMQKINKPRLLQVIEQRMVGCILLNRVRSFLFVFLIISIACSIHILENGALHMGQV